MVSLLIAAAAVSQEENVWNTSGISAHSEDGNIYNSMGQKNVHQESF